jgi:hypothetical protein
MPERPTTITYYDEILGRPPTIAEDWAHVILAGDAWLGCAAPDDVYEAKLKELVEIITRPSSTAQRLRRRARTLAFR